MSDAKLLSVLLMGVLAGAAVFSISCAVLVWRRRNAAPAGGRRWRPALAKALLGGAAVLLAATWIQIELRDRQGVLSAEGVFTLRSPEDLQAAWLTQEARVGEGDLLARFTSPPNQAKADMLVLRQASLEAQQEILEREPVRLDGELVRRHQEISADLRQLQSTRDTLLPARDAVLREQMTQQLVYRQRLRELELEAARLQAEHRQAQARADYSRTHAKRLKSIAVHGATCCDEEDKAALELQVAQAQVEKLTAQIREVDKQKQHVQGDLEKLEAMTQTQSRDLCRQVEQVDKSVEQSQQDRERLVARLAEDKTRAELLRQRQLEQTRLEIRQCRAERDGLERTLAVRSPVEGRVLFRCASPQMALDRAPLLCVGPADAFRARLRLTAGELGSLEQAGSVVLLLKQPGVYRRFTGRLYSHRTLDQDTGYVLAELLCQPPEECVQALAEGERVEVELDWKPPLTNLPVVWAAAALALVGTFLAAGAAWKRNHGPAPDAAATGQDEQGKAAPSDGPVDLDQALGRYVSVAYGEEGRRLHLLGHRFARALGDGRVDDDLLAALEWALDRHQGRAVAILRQCLSEQELTASMIQEYLDAREPMGGANGDRLARVCRILLDDEAADLSCAGAHGP